MKLKAITPQYVEGRLVPPGHEFEVTAEFGERLVKEGGAKAVTPKATKAKASAEAAK